MKVMARKSTALEYKEMHVFVLEYSIFEKFSIKKYLGND
jgi:hypothetical protein